MKDYYSILQVSRTASSKEIKSAYRNLSKIYHPDVNNAANASTIFIEIKEAYEVLIDENRRVHYNHLLDISLNRNFQQSNIIPTISFFYADCADFNLGDIITFSWEVSDADVVELRPFGNVTQTGSKKIKITDVNSDLLVELICYNSISRNYVFSQIILKKKITNTNNINKTNFDTPNQRDDKSEFYARLISENPHINPKHFQQEKLFGIYGRISEKEYGLRFTVFTTIYLIGMTLFWANGDLNSLFCLLLNAFYYTLLYIQALKRFHDFNSNGNYAFLSVIPIVCWFQAAYLYEKDGDSELNNYGINPDLLIKKNIDDLKNFLTSKLKATPILTKITIGSAVLNIVLVICYFLIPKYEIKTQLLKSYQDITHTSKNTQIHYYFITSEGDFQVSEKMNKLFVMYKPDFIFIGKNSITDAVSYIRVQSGNEEIIHYLAVLNYNSPIPILYFLFLLFEYYILFVDKKFRNDDLFTTFLGFILFINLMYLFFVIF